MRVGRTILVFLVALSLAMLPMARAFAMASDQASAANEVVASHDHHCDHDGMPTDRAMKDCPASADCAAKCASAYAVVFAGVIIPAPIAGMESSFVSNPFDSQPTTPPYRPPRI